jgi:hypothetical protein
MIASSCPRVVIKTETKAGALRITAAVMATTFGIVAIANALLTWAFRFAQSK